MPLKLALLTAQIYYHHVSLWRKYAPEVKTAKGIKRCWVKVKWVNNPAWTAQYTSGYDDEDDVHFIPMCPTSVGKQFALLVL